MIIVGAGLAGLLCGALNPGSTIFESKSENEISHKALFRLRSDRISELTGIPFKKVTVTKGIWFENENVPMSPRMAHLYSKKVSGKITDRSITNIDTCTRYIPPEDFIQQLRNKNTHIKYDFDHPFAEGEIPIISTIPMPILAHKLGDKNNQEFNQNCSGKRIFINQFRVKNCNSYSTMYYPGNDPFYRVSLNDNILIIESISEIREGEFDIIIKSMGLSWVDISESIVDNHIQPLGKINEIDNRLRSDFITKMTVENNIYSLGRFATWRPGILLDDICEDIFVIRKLIEGGNYAVKLYNQNKE